MYPERAVRKILRSTDRVRNRPSGSSTVFPGYYRLIRTQLKTSSELSEALNALRPYFKACQEDFSAFLQNILDAGYNLKSLNDYVDADLGKANVFLRYDVHPNDILAAVALAELHEKFEVPGVFYLNWDFSDLERGLRTQYLFLRKFSSAYVQFGLHAAPPTSWMFLDSFRGKRKEATKFIKGDEFRSYLESLLAEHHQYGFSGKRIGGIIREIEARFSQIAVSFREEFPEATTISAHGNVLNSRLHAICREDPRYRPLLELFESRRFLTKDRYGKFGFRREMTSFPLSSSGCNHVLFDGRADSLKADLEVRMKAATGIVFIFHPNRWFNGHCARILGLHADSSGIREHMSKFIGHATRLLPAIPGATKSRDASPRAIDRRTAVAAGTTIDLDSVVFIAGFARGGTTWLRRCVGAHPEITEIPGETVFTRERPLTAASIRRLVLKKIRDNALAGSRFVTKGPANSMVFASMAQLLPDAKHIYIIRDPRDVFVSHKRGSREWMKGKNSTVQGCMSKTQRYHDAYLGADTLSNVLTVRFEDLHQDFPQTYRRICRFLGVSDDDRVIAECLAKTSFSRLTGRDHVEDPDAGARKGVVGEWATHLTAEEVAWYQSDPYWQSFLKRYGYDWRIYTVGGIIRAIGDSGADGAPWTDAAAAPHPEQPRLGARVLHLLDGLGVDAPVNQAIEAGRLTQLASVPLCYGLPLRVGEGEWRTDVASMMTCLAALRAATPEAPLALYLDYRRTRGPFEELTARATDFLHRLNDLPTRNVAPTFILIDAAELQHLESETKLAGDLSQRHRLPLQWLGGPENLANATARIEIRSGTIRMTGLPAGFDVLEAGAYKALPLTLLTVMNRPLLESFSTPLNLGFRDDLIPG